MTRKPTVHELKRVSMAGLATILYTFIQVQMNFRGFDDALLIGIGVLFTFVFWAILALWNRFR